MEPDYDQADVETSNGCGLRSFPRERVDTPTRQTTVSATFRARYTFFGLRSETTSDETASQIWKSQKSLSDSRSSDNENISGASRSSGRLLYTVVSIPETT